MQSEMTPVEEITPEEMARKVSYELREFHIAVAAYDAAELQKIINLLNIYQSAQEKISRQ